LHFYYQDKNEVKLRNNKTHFKPNRELKLANHGVYADELVIW